MGNPGYVGKRFASARLTACAGNRTVAGYQSMLRSSYFM